MVSFDKSDFNWQVEQFQRRVSEWLELNISPVAEQAIRNTDWTISDWVINVTIWLSWLILGSVIALLLWQIFKIIRPYLETIGLLKIRTRKEEKAPVSPPAIEWEQRSSQLAAKGEYREACRSLYMAMLQRLHEATVAPQQPSRTDGEYLQILRQIPRWQTYQVLLQTHERLCFNDDILSSTVFEHCQKAYQDLEQYLSSN
jgi:hypothetical protein